MYVVYRVMLRQRATSNEGQTMVEYGVVLSVICLVTVTAFSALSGGIGSAVDQAVQLIVELAPG